MAAVALTLPAYSHHAAVTGGVIMAANTERTFVPENPAAVPPLARAHPRRRQPATRMSTPQPIPVS